MNPKNEDPRVDLSWKRFLMPHMNPEGVKFLLAFAGCSFVLLILPIVGFLGYIGLALTIFTFYFFRDPTRVTPVGDHLIVSPADGIVSNIKEVVPPPEIDIGTEPMTRISIFMSVFSVHVNRSPATGTVHKINYRPGKFLNVADKDNEDNERQEYSLIMPSGHKIGFIQIAGLVARRIVSWTQEGQQLKAGQRFGMIRFGSRLDIYLPKGVCPKVCLGQVAVAGETILADVSQTNSLPTIGEER